MRVGPIRSLLVTAVAGAVLLAGAATSHAQEQKPKQIVSLSASLTEMLYAVGAGKQVVAVDQHSDYPSGTPTTDLSGFRPNVEAIASYEPDLVVLASDRDGVVDALAGLGIPTLLLSSPERLSDVRREITAIGKATGHSGAAKELNDEMRRKINAIAAKAPERKQPLRYFYELSSSGHSATSETFIGDLLGRIGLASIADAADDASGGFPQLSTEYILDADPDVIFLAHTDGTNDAPADVAARPGFDQLAAVRNDHVVALNPDLAARWGPRVVTLLRTAAAATRNIKS